MSCADSPIWFFKPAYLSTYQFHNIDDALDKLSNRTFCDDGKSLCLSAPIWYSAATYVIRAMCDLWFNISKVPFLTFISVFISVWYEAKRVPQKMSSTKSYFHSSTENWKDNNSDSNVQFLLILLRKESHY